MTAPAAGLPQGLVDDYTYYADAGASPGYLYQESVQNGLNAASADLLE